MPIAVLPGSYSAEGCHEIKVRRAAVVDIGVRRRGSRSQGRALEALGHAVEYLVDSRMFAPAAGGDRSEDEAIQILMRLSRAVFAECPEVVSLRRRFRLWVAGRTRRVGRMTPIR